ncbi:MAG: extracellular solute-binding protein [Bdellovibrionales bacterium]|jgi:putative spermidine/putrescine transport system substrate-binding protein|nr:extracellular solute-binding protein [Bdellovibrionales bacterium]MBT3526322.1 extracellular solute-binding protein [Bdellovibrionales bacterium]MBT7670666.1 extracellular solute-binding protein [Bdellovibrionales bacterium]MBT7766652.1 extracellular solute-binding protein [Bdellovibrionales bacterium]
MKFDKYRRKFIINGARTAATALAASALPFPQIALGLNRKPTIKVLGTHVTLQESIRKRAEKELGINIEFYPVGSAEAILKASTDPSSFDIYEQWSNSIKVLWRANAIQPIEIKKLTYWNEINDLTKTGKITPNAKIGLGDAPHKLLYIQKDGTIGENPTDQISFMPYVHNTDSYGYNSRVIPKGEPYKTESWGWLLNREYRGKVALVNAPTIGLFDAALAVKANGLMDFHNMGNMTRQEVDELFRILIEYKRGGQFRGVWSSVPHSVQLMEQGEVIIQSMFSPGVSMLRGKGIPCIYAAPKEGYRAWHGVMCLSRNTKGEKKDAAYRFMNWWLSGWPGAFIARQGYYISNPDRSKDYMTSDEWNYWYKGLAAQSDLPGTNGMNVVRRGEMRSGGSYWRRFENVAIWNSVMDTYEYSLIKWNEFLMS